MDTATNPYESYQVAAAQAARRGGWHRTDTIGRFEIWQRTDADRPQVVIRDALTGAALLLFDELRH